MAGVRVGYLIAKPEIVEMLKPRVMSYINMMGVYGAMAALDDEKFHQFSLKKNDESKEYIYQISNELGMRYVPSSTNFVFVKTGVDINELLPKMMDQGVMVGRPFPPLMDWCRISTGTMKEMDQWGQAMRKIFA
jgi:histidinol-phosphate aminotransferase